ncbi:plasmid pRiA4b ORF-3 family protein [Planococcus sp. YIM B11945]|uniref:plasmid pRiA4b ORF-3 family protein n=1 Tax=Planococcus sp. YIM B11945 TaxID=3435410 RepID=UPI003D7D9F10
MMIYQFKVTLKDVKPPVWRRLQVDSEMSFYDFHYVLQSSFGWTDSHLPMLNVIKANGRKVSNVEISRTEEEFGIYTMDALDEGKEFLKDWFTVEKDQMLYTYDFGDDWEHDIVLEKKLEPSQGTEYPRCVGKRRTLIY